MKKILVIDADNETLNIFSNGLKEHADKFELLTAANTEEAQAVLANLEIDLIAIDIKSNQIETLDQLSIMVKEHSKTSFFVFAETGNPELKIKVKVLGIQNYFEKPLDTAQIVKKINEDVISNVGGQVHGISLPSFLQMSEMEKSSCTLKITSKGDVGYLFLSNGALISAKTQNKSKEEAAYEILSWDDSAIEILKAAKKQKRDIKMPLMNLLMEGLRIKDEKSANMPASETQRATPEIKISKVQDLIAKQKKAAPPPELPKADQSSVPPVEVEPKKKEKVKSKPQVDEEGLSDYHKDIIEKAREAQRKKMLAIMTTAIILIICAASGTFVWIKIIKPNRVKAEYENLITKIGGQSSYEEMEKMMLNYINTNKDSIYTQNAKEKLKEIRQLMEERDFDQAVATVQALAVDSQFESKSAAIYQDFLRKYPQSVFKEQINQKIDSLPSFKDDKDYQHVQNIPESAYLERINSYKEYLATHPDGKYRDQVSELIKEIGKEYHQYIEQEVEQCEKSKNLDKCLKLDVAPFVKSLNNNFWTSKINSLIKRIQDKKDYSVLLAISEKIDNDLKAQRKVFADYLKKNPTSTEKNRIQGEIKKIDVKLSQISEWRNLVSYIMNPKNDVFNRLSKLNSYMALNQRSPYIGEAQKAQKMLEKEKRDVLWRQKLEKEKKEKERDEKLAARRELERLALETKKMEELVKSTNNRYKNNNDGTVIDTKTGLMWCLLDSQTQLQKCVNFDAALNYIKSLNTGGYRDWRLPTANELVIIYKNQPFFPSTRTLWYWSSDVILQGWNKKVNIVTSKEEIGWKKALVMPEKCGAVRAVRP